METQDMEEGQLLVDGWGEGDLTDNVNKAEDRAAAELRRPTLITVKRVGRYPEIVRHRFEQEK